MCGAGPCSNICTPLVLAYNTNLVVDERPDASPIIASSCHLDIYDGVDVTPPRCLGRVSRVSMV